MLKKLMLMKPLQLFITILLPFLLSIIIIIIIQSSLLYMNFEKLALDMLYNQQKSNLQNISHNVTVMQQTARALSTQAFFDYTIKDLLYSDIEPEDYMRYMNKLYSYKNIYPFLDSIYIYNTQHIYALPSFNFSNDLPDFYDSEIVQILGDMNKYESHSIIPRRIPYTNYGSAKPEPDKFTNVYSYLFYESQHQSGKIGEAIILNISADWLWQGINPDKKNETRVFIVNDKGRLISNDIKYTMMTDLSGTGYIRSVLASKEQIGNIRTNVDGVDSFITYVASDVLDWKLVSITPYRNVVRNIEILKMNTVLFVLLILVAGTLISLFLSRRLYIPIKSLIQNFNKLESEKLTDSYYKKQELLKKLIIYSGSTEVEAILKQFTSDVASLDPTEKFLLILIKIDYYSDFCNNFSLEDRKVMKYGIMNIVSELLSPVFKNECVDMDDDQIVALINYSPSSLPSNNESLLSVVKGIQFNMEKYLDISSSFTFSDVFSGLEESNIQYQKSVDLSYYRIILGRRALIFQNKVDIQTADFKYPLEKDKLLTDALMLGHISDAEKIFKDMILHASQYSITSLNTTLIHLLLSINNAVDVINSNKDYHIKYDFNFYLSKLQRFETLDEIQAVFFDLFNSFLHEVKMLKDSKYILLIEDVVNTINREFPNPNLSLESISEMVNLSPSYLGRLFKKYKGVSIPNYISNVRLEKAKDLLSTTEESVISIMNNLGFLSRSNFFTLFKKAYGITPNQYRAKAKWSISSVI